MCLCYHKVHKRLLSSLRPYQEACIEASLKAFHERSIKRQAVSLPVGSGKTVIFANLITRLKLFEGDKKKVLVLAHREELLLQAKKQIERFAPGLRVAVERGPERCDPSMADVIVASVATLGRKRSEDDRLSRFDPSQFKCVIVDEAHHGVADTYLRIMAHFGLGPQPEDCPIKWKETAVLPNLLLWGCSATLNRRDERALGGLFDEIVYQLDLTQMMEEGWLAPVQTVQVETNIDLTSATSTVADYDQRDLSLAINTPLRNELVARTWQKVAHQQHKRASTIVFGLNVAHVMDVEQAFMRLDPPPKTAVLTGMSDAAKRREILRSFANGELEVLLNCAVLTEGTDLPRTDCILVARPTCNTSLYTQMVGRGLRPSPGKDYCLVLDFIDKDRSDRSLITFPSLLAARNSTKKTDQGPKEEEEKRKKRTVSEIDPSNLQLQLHHSIGLSEEKPKPGFGLAWCQLDREGLIHFVGHPHRDCVLVHQFKDQSTARIRIVSAELEIPSELLLWTEHSSLMPLLLSWLEDNHLLEPLRENAYWRRQRPVTKPQQALLGKLASKVGGIHESHFKEIFGWDVGRASSAISKAILRKSLLKDPVRTWSDLVTGL